MITRADAEKFFGYNPDTVLRTREAIRRLIARTKVQQRKRDTIESLSPRLRRDVGLDREEVR